MAATKSMEPSARIGSVKNVVSREIVNCGFVLALFCLTVSLAWKIVEATTTQPAVRTTSRKTEARFMVALEER
jgi:hypothetical protein